jgi:hypothetical protein
VASAKVEFAFAFAAVDGSEAAPSNASSVSVRDGYVSGDPEAETDVAETEDVEDQTTTTTAMIAIAKSWRAHASVLMLFVRHLRYPFLSLLRREREERTPAAD